MTMLGCIADDFTGGTDVAAAMKRSGLNVVLSFGEPTTSLPTGGADAVVVALKSRTAPVADAVGATMRSWRWLHEEGADHVYLKYCSTFDSTDDGNIGPAVDALLDATNERMTLICPASPEHGRTVYQGHLFVGSLLLSDSPMRHHPLTPMTDSDLVSVLGRQTPGKVGLLPLQVVRAGEEAVSSHLKELAAADVRHVVVDATQPSDLQTVARASSDFTVLTGGAGFAGALGVVIAGSATSAPKGEIDFDLPAGPGVVLAGSCSHATLTQVAEAAASFRSHRLDPATTPDPTVMLETARAWLRDNWDAGPLLIYSSASPEDQAAARAAMGPETPEILERTLGELAREARALGAARIVVAGGETSGAVVTALGIESVQVMGEEDTGVPWCLPSGEPDLVLLLKSGNFGRDDLLVRAMRGVAS